MGTEAEQLWPHLDPSRSSVVVVEAGEQIVGCAVLFHVLHADCVWIHPDHQRRAAVARRLWWGVEQTARDTWHARTVAVGATLTVMAKFLRRVGAIRLPGEHFVWALK